MWRPTAVSTGGRHAGGLGTSELDRRQERRAGLPEARRPRRQCLRFDPREAPRRRGPRICERPCRRARLDAVLERDRRGLRQPDVGAGQAIRPDAKTTVSYLTYSFAFPAEWDYTQQVAIAPDEVARRGRDIDVFGMQLCSADGDPYRATCCLDVVRKYGKPMWVVDLVDFTSGVHIGLPAMEKATQVIAHGAEGIVYCGWHLT